LIEDRLGQQPGSRLTQRTDQQLGPRLIRVRAAGRRFDAFSAEQTAHLRAQAYTEHSQAFLDVPLLQKLQRAGSALALWSVWKSMPRPRGSPGTHRAGLLGH